MDTTLDGLLDRRVTLEQPAKGYRVSIDTVLLAAAVPAESGQTLLDLGSGVGGAMLCVACRVPGLSVTALEIQAELYALCQRNASRNLFSGSFSVRRGDVAQLPADLGAFDHVIMNAPYHPETQHTVSKQATKRIANAEKEGELGQWILAADRSLKTGGTLTLIHRADRLPDILAMLSGNFNGIELLTVHPKAAAAPLRVILRARKGGDRYVRQHRKLVLHGPEGGYTAEAEAILRHANKMDFVAEVT